jgi:hypothetical protein
VAISGHTGAHAGRLTVRPFVTGIARRARAASGLAPNRPAVDAVKIAVGPVVRGVARFHAVAPLVTIRPFVTVIARRARAAARRPRDCPDVDAVEDTIGAVLRAVSGATGALAGRVTIRAFVTGIARRARAAPSLSPGGPAVDAVENTVASVLRRVVAAGAVLGCLTIRPFVTGSANAGAITGRPINRATVDAVKIAVAPVVGAGAGSHTPRGRMTISPAPAVTT